MIRDYNVGDRVKITLESWKNIRNGNRSIHAYPDDSFVASSYALMKNEIEGTVSHRFRPGYEMTVRFDNGRSMHMKDHWVSRV